MTKRLSLVLAALWLASLAGCGSNSAAVDAADANRMDPPDALAQDSDTGTDDGSSGDAQRPIDSGTGDAEGMSGETGVLAPDSGAEAGKSMLEGGADGGTGCNTAADCAAGQLCVVRDDCSPLPNGGGPCGTSSACVENPCDGGVPVTCSACVFSLCTGYSGCTVTPDAGTVSCVQGG